MFQVVFMERLGILKKSEHCIFASADHGVAQTEKIFKRAVVSEEMGNEFNQTFGCKASSNKILSLCAVHNEPGLEPELFEFLALARCI